MTARAATSRPLADRPTAQPLAAILTVALIAALLLVVAEFATIASVSVEGESCEVINDASPELADRCSLSGWERHGGALILLALVTVGAAAVAAARRGTNRAIGSVLLAIGAVTLGLTLIGDLPVANDTGAIGRDFAGASAHAGLGFYLELLGGVLALLAGVLALLPARRASASA